MSSAAKIAANIANAQLSTGPRTEEGKAASSQNALKSGLFSNRDVIRPGEEAIYEELDDALLADLAPVSQLEYHLVNEIRRAMWRARRCGEVEGVMAEMCVETAGPILDPMQNEATAKLQFSVDRAQCHRLLHKCTAELRKLQTERQTRNETLEAGTDLIHLGLSETRSVNKAIHELASTRLTQNKVGEFQGRALAEHELRLACAILSGVLKTDFPDPVTPVTIPTQPARNAPCKCGSGLKYEHCCGKDAAPMLRVA